MRQSIYTLSLVSLLSIGAACTKNDSGTDSSAITVRSTADTCEVSQIEAKSGDLVFDVKNDGSTVTEFYLMADDGQRVVGEVENIGPGITRSLAVNVAAGSYFTVCKPGMEGDGIRAVFTVTDGG